MEQNRHRAPEPHHRGRLALAVLIGLVLGAAAVGGAWWVSNEPATPSASSQPTPTNTSHASQKSTETRHAVAVPSAAAAPPTTSDDAVLLLGDSLAVGIAPYVDAGLGERTLSVDAAEGRGSATSVSLLESYADSSAPIWIVSLGTNDNPDEFEQPASAIVDLAGPNRCVVWFDVWRVDTDEQINATLGDLAAEHANVHLIPWHDTSALHSEWFSGEDVHPSSDGYAVRGQMAIDAVQEYCS